MFKRYLIKLIPINFGFFSADAQKSNGCYFSLNIWKFRLEKEVLILLLGIFEFDDHGSHPSTLQYMLAFSSEQTSKSPPSSTFCFLMAKKSDGS